MIVDYVEHHGTKGMKWGVRRERRLNTLKRVADGQASGKDMLNAMSMIRGKEIVRSKGIKNAARKKVKKEEARKKRIEMGKATTIDLLRHIGSSRLSDLRPFDR